MLSNKIGLAVQLPREDNETNVCLPNLVAEMNGFRLLVKFNSKPITFHDQSENLNDFVYKILRNTFELLSLSPFIRSIKLVSNFRHVHYHAVKKTNTTTIHHWLETIFSYDD